MNTDRYTKTVLTVIAIALTWIAIKPMHPVPSAWAQSGPMTVRIEGIDTSDGILPVGLQSIGQRIHQPWDALPVQTK